MKKRIYIAGAGGMLGEAFYNVFKNNYELKCTDIDINENWINYLDFRNYKEYLNDVINFKPNFLFHLGAHTDLEYCEKNPKDTYITNTLSVENATYISNNLDIPLLFISTAGIFDGKKELYDDWDLPNPLGNYAKSKYEAEKFVQHNCKRYLICRAGWMMGGGLKKDKKFVNKVIKKISDGDKEIFVVNDKLGTPTYTYDFANNVVLLLKHELWGLYNLVCQGNTNRLEVALELIKILNLSNDVKITKVNSNFYANEYFAPRPPSENLLNYKLNLRSLNIMRDWKECLKEYLTKEYSEYIKK